MNPKFDFYSGLLSLLKGKGFQMSFAKHLMEIYATNMDVISLEDVTLENLEAWHSQMWGYRGGKDLGIEKAEEIAEAAFEDLASQLRNQAVRLLHIEYKEWAGISGDLFIHVRRIKDLGESIATVTVVTDDTEALRRFLDDPDHYVRMEGHIHHSESGSVTEPDSLTE